MTPRPDRGSLPLIDQGSLPLIDQGSLPLIDQGAPELDAGPDTASTVTFAQICTSTCPSGEVCVFMDPGATKGVCLRTCSQPNTECSTPDPAYRSGCMEYYNMATGTVIVCMVLCRFQGQNYPCPSPEHYCKPYGVGLRVCAARN